MKTGILHWKEAGLPYIWGNLDDKWNLKDKAVLAAIGVFGTFVIYSLFQVSVRKRMSQYSVMQTLGMESKCTFGVLTSELWMIFAVAYPVGCVVTFKVYTSMICYFSSKWVFSFTIMGSYHH